MTSFYTGLSPAEHTLIGWSMYYKQYFRLIDTLPKEDSITKEKLGDEYYLLDSLPKENIFSKIEKTNPDVELILFH